MPQKRSRRERRQRQQSERPDIAVSFWLVAFLDILGYRNALAKLDFYPLPPQGSPAFHAIGDGLARAVRLRTRLLAQVEEFLTDRGVPPPPPELRNLPAQARQLATTWRQIKPWRVPGPDHIVFGCSLAPEPDHFPMRGVYHVLLTATATMLLQLFIGATDPDDTLPLRGGIDIAPGALLRSDGFLYSPALTRAYDLEQKQAIYPRTIVGARLISFIDAHVHPEPIDLDGQYNQQLATKVHGMLFRDRDDQVALDFLGETMRGLVDAAFAQELASGAWRYAQQAHDRAKAVGDNRILAKYAWLLDYMRPRLPQWSVNT